MTELPEPVDMNAVLRRHTDSEPTKAWGERLFGTATDDEPATEDDDGDAT